MACTCGHAEEEHGTGFFRECDECGCLDYEEAEEAAEEAAAAPPRKLVTFDQARRSAVQHKKPCSDCPFARDALPGWLGSQTVDEWVRMVHGETLIECHTIVPQQCAGAAIYRSNVAKLARPPLLKLPADRERVFATPMEFRDHHDKRKEEKTMKTKYKSQSTAKAAEARNRMMFGRGFVPADIASKLCGFDLQAVYRWAREGIVASERMGKFVYLSLADVVQRVPQPFEGKKPKEMARALLFSSAPKKAA